MSLRIIFDKDKIPPHELDTIKSVVEMNEGKLKWLWIIDMNNVKEIVWEDDNNES